MEAHLPMAGPITTPKKPTGRVPLKAIRSTTIPRLPAPSWLPLHRLNT